MLLVRAQCDSRHESSSHTASLRVATGPKVTTGHILVKTHHIFIKFEDYISLVKVVKHEKIQLICITVAMATAVYVPMDVCPYGKNYSE